MSRWKYVLGAVSCSLIACTGYAVGTASATYGGDSQSALNSRALDILASYYGSLTNIDASNPSANVTGTVTGGVSAANTAASNITAQSAEGTLIIGVFSYAPKLETVTSSIAPTAAGQTAIQETWFFDPTSNAVATGPVTTEATVMATQETVKKSSGSNGPITPDYTIIVPVGYCFYDALDPILYGSPFYGPLILYESTAYCTAPNSVLQDVTWLLEDYYGEIRFIASSYSNGPGQDTDLAYAACNAPWTTYFGYQTNAYWVATYSVGGIPGSISFAWVSPYNDINCAS